MWFMIYFQIANRVGHLYKYNNGHHEFIVAVTSSMFDFTHNYYISLHILGKIVLFFFYS